MVLPFYIEAKSLEAMSAAIYLYNNKNVQLFVRFVTFGDCTLCTIKILYLLQRVSFSKIQKYFSISLYFFYHKIRMLYI